MNVRVILQSTPSSNLQSSFFNSSSQSRLPPSSRQHRQEFSFFHNLRVAIFFEGLWVASCELRFSLRRIRVLQVHEVSFALLELGFEWCYFCSNLFELWLLDIEFCSICCYFEFGFDLFKLLLLLFELLIFLLRFWIRVRIDAIFVAIFELGFKLLLLDVNFKLIDVNCCFFELGFELMLIVAIKSMLIT